MTDLERTIEDHRAAYRSDLHIDRLVSRQPPTSLDLHTGQLEEEPGTRVGMSMSGRLLRYLGHPEGYGASFPWAKAFWLLKVECRRKHRDHRGPERTYWRGSLCHEAVKLVIIGGESRGSGPLSPEHAASILKVETLEPLLTRCFAFMEERIDDFRAKAERRAREDEGFGPGAVPREVPAHHAPSDDHIRDCPNVECKRRRAA